MKNKCLLSVFVLLLFCYMEVSAQRRVSGKIVDADTEMPIERADVRVGNSHVGTTTDEKGEFVINRMPQGIRVLNISHVSYKPQLYEVDDDMDRIVIRLQEVHVDVGQVVVTGTGTRHRMKDSPVPISVITSKDLAVSGASTLEEALQKLSPAFSSMTNGMGTTLSMNGLPDNYFIFLENGRRMDGEDAYSQINLATVKRIEVLNGASSTLYGTNAIGGVINIITDDEKRTAEISTEMRHSSKNRQNQSVTAYLHAGEVGFYSLFCRQQADSWRLSPYEEVKGELKETNKIASSGFMQNSFKQRLTYDASSKLFLHLSVGFHGYKTRRPVEVYNYDMKRETFSYGGGAKYVLDANDYLTADFYSDNYVSTYCFFKDDKTYKAIAGERQKRKQTRHQHANMKGVFALGEHHNLSVGAEHLIDVLKSESDNIGHETACTVALYVQDEIRISDKWKALAGVRYTYHEMYKSHFSPNIALMYTIRDVNIRGSYSMGFRSPSLSELYATDVAKTTDRMTIGSIYLKPEKSNYLSLNSEYVNSRFSASATIFHNAVEDMIDYQTIAEGEQALAQYGHREVRQRDNVAKANILGISFSVHARLVGAFGVGAGFVHYDTEDVKKKQPIDKSIKNAANIHADWDHVWRNYRLCVGVNGRINSRRFSKTYGYAPEYQLWDLNLRQVFFWKKIVFEPCFGIENIFNYVDDRPYNSNYATLSPGRAFYLQFKLTFAD